MTIPASTMEQQCTAECEAADAIAKYLNSMGVPEPKARDLAIDHLMRLDIEAAKHQKEHK